MKHILIFLCVGLWAVSFGQNRSDTIHVAHYDINLSIVDLPQQKIGGYADLKVVPQIVPLAYCDLDLASLSVDSVLHENRAVGFSHSGTRLRVTFDNAVTTQDTQRIRVYYQGKPAASPTTFGGFYFTSTMAFNMGVGIGVEPPAFGRSWFPCLDEFTDKSTYTFQIRTDADKMAVCGGVLTDSATLGDQTKFWKWELTSPIPTYLASIAVGNFQCYKDTFHGIERIIPIEVYATSAYIGKVQGSFVNLKTVLRDYETRLGAYSWQRVGYVAVPFNNGAMEHATNITYPQVAINGNTQWEYLIFHELSHSWFGNLLTCSNSENMWINEGFATYAETLAEEALDATLTRYKTSVRELHRYVLKNVHTNDSGYFALDSVSQNNIYGSTSYKKGGLVVHTLRHYLGDSLFFSGLRTLFAENAFGNIDSKQFFEKMSQITGVDLTDFYLGWVHQPGFLHFSIDSVVKKEQTSNQYLLYFKQKLHNARYFANSNKVDVEFVSPNGERFTLPSISFSGENDCVEVTLPFAPDFWVIDPDENLGDAVIKYPITVSNTTLINCTDANFRLKPNTLTKQTDARVEYHLVAPDPLKTPNPDIYKISDNRYWHIEYYGSIITDGEFRFLYDAKVNQPDYNLFQGYTMNDLILLYRRNAAADWQILPSTVAGSNSAGTLTASSSLPGEYALAMGKKNVSVPSISSNSTVFVYPNPTTGKLKIENGELKMGNVELYDIYGKKQFSVFNFQFSIDEIDISHLANGMYFLKIDNKVVKVMKQ